MPNVLNREFSVTEPSKVWVSISPIFVSKKDLYLTTVLDLYDRKS
jgi:transposase InsO family protein